MTDTATLTLQLAAAEAALHKLMVGASVVSVSYDGSATQFTRANVAELRRYIVSLNRQLGSTPVRSGSQRVIF